MKINTLIIDDDANWRFTTGKFVLLHPLLELVGSCESALEALAVMAGNEVDLIICDIEMPGLSGLGFARSLQNGPLIIFFTSHPHYALDCYEVSPVDFLVKPLNYERFMRSIETVRQRLLNAPEPVTLAPYFFVREGHDYVQIAYHDVLYMKAREHFLEIVTERKTYLPMLPINKIEEQLKGDVFLRVHRSFLVNRAAISLIARNEMTLVTGDIIPIGDQYRAKVHRLHVDRHLLSRSH